MKKTVITLAAALTLGGFPLKALAQDQDPDQAPILVQDQQSEPDAEQLIKKKRKQRQEQVQQSDEGQGEQPVKKRKKQQVEEQLQQQPADDQAEQPVKKRKKQQVEEQLQQQPADEQAEQPVKKRKKQQAEQPEDQLQQPVEDQTGQPQKKKKKQQAEQPDDQQPGTEQSAEPEQQPVKRKKKEQAEQPQDQQQTAPEQTTGQPQTEKPATAEVPPEVTQYLSEGRSLKQLSDQELVARVRTGRNLVKTKGLPANVRQQVADEFKKARAEAMARDQGKATGQQTTEQPPAGETTTGKGDQIPAQGEGQPGQQTEQTAQQPGEGQQPTANPDKQQVQKLDGNKGSPEAESKARAYLDNAGSADRLSDDQLRDRLDNMRDLMAGNQLSRDSERALRQRLKVERDILRGRVAEKVVGEERKGDVIPGPERRRDRNDRKWDQWAERDVLRDRRRSDELEEGELRRRIDVYRVAINDDRYDAQQRAYWRDMMDRDRRYLGGRLVNDRRDRERYWRDRRDKNELDIAIDINLGPDREPPEAAFMDEIDDEELEDYLVAAPRRRIARRYTVEEIEEDPEVRTAMPAIEIDNIHFGFNESFVREEEVSKLDRIAEVIEKILAAHPGEVFMIAGHTDAVGSDSYNLELSRERAQAVKKALTSYYVIPPKNLVTVGYGERYLKIPTSDAEEENRRVSLQRVTPLVGEAEAEE